MQHYIQHPNRALQVYIQHYLQHPKDELYIRSSRSIFSTTFKLRMQSSIFSYAGLYSVLYSTSQCRALYSVLQVYIQHYIQTPNVEIYIRLCRSIFSTIFNIRMQSSIFGLACLYSALHSNSECRAQYSAMQVYIQRYIQHPNVELYIRSSRSIFSTIFKPRM